MKHLYVVKKFVMAESAYEAMEASEKLPVHEAFRIEETKAEKAATKDAVGFAMVGDERIPYEGQPCTDRKG